MLKWLYKILSWEGIAGIAICSILLLAFLYTRCPIGAKIPYEELNTCMLRITKAQISYGSEIMDIMNNSMVDRPYRHDRVMPYYKRALFIRKNTLKVLGYIDSCKKEIAQMSGCYPDIFDCAPERMKKSKIVFHSFCEYCMGNLVNQKIATLAGIYLNSLDAPDRKVIEPILSISKTGKQISPGYLFKGWSKKELENVSPEMITTLLSTYEVLVCLSEYPVLIKLFEESHDYGCGFGDGIQVIALPTKSTVVAGEKVNAEIYFAAYNRYVQAVITASKGRIVNTQDGVATWTGTDNKPGIQKVCGSATLKTSRGIVGAKWKFQYIVIEPGAAVNLDKMNTCFVGVKNPITVSAPGYEEDKLTLRVAGAKVTQTGAGHFNIFFAKTTVKEVYAFLDATDSEGQVSTVGSVKIKIKELPLPVAMIGDDGVKAEQKNTEFDVRYRIKSYNFYLIKTRERMMLGPYAIRGSAFANDDDADEAMRHIRQGDRIVATDIVANDENGVEYEVPGASMTW